MIKGKPSTRRAHGISFKSQAQRAPAQSSRLSLRRVVLTPQLHNQSFGAETLLILDCGHSMAWSAVGEMPGFVMCATCGVPEVAFAGARLHKRADVGLAKARG
jgi:hypothetical protein